VKAVPDSPPGPLRACYRVPPLFLDQRVGMEALSEKCNHEMKLLSSLFRKLYQWLPPRSDVSGQTPAMVRFHNTDREPKIMEARTAVRLSRK